MPLILGSMILAWDRLTLAVSLVIVEIGVFVNCQSRLLAIWQRAILVVILQ
jgi:hypothetical protein